MSNLPRAGRILRRMLPAIALALGLPPHWFDEAFRQSQFSLRLSHYPPVGTHFHSSTGPVALLKVDTGERVGTLTPGIDVAGTVTASTAASEVFILLGGGVIAQSPECLKWRQTARLNKLNLNLPVLSIALEIRRRITQ